MHTDKLYVVYMMTNKKRGTLYTGFSGILEERVYQHKNKIIKGFTSRYNLTRFVYYELYADPLTAIQREKQLKKWNRSWKIQLIEKHNPDWNDLYDNGEVLPLPIPRNEE